MSLFTSRAAPGRVAQKPWITPMSYPAIKGLSRVHNVTMKNFGTFCGSNDRDYVLMTAPAYGDIIHPVQFSEITLSNVQHDSKVRIVFSH